jgi:methylenetetrahydrofolate--tRNA-(uracil-5-)-methyltransferase
MSLKNNKSQHYEGSLKIRVIGAGLAGVEAAYYLLKKGYEVELYEMRPKVMTPAHRTGDFAELVCSNSLRSDDIFNGVGLLKHEMRQFDSITMKAAEVAQVPAGSSLAVDRTIFSQTIHSTLTAFKNLTIMDDVFSQIDENIPTIIATGPLTHDDLMTSLGSFFNKEFLHFFDAVSPILDGTTINMDVCYLKSRYDKGDADYINCPMDKETYLKFYDALMSSEKVEVKDFENNVFEGCMPVETMAERGIDTLRFGPLKPVGLEIDGERPYAVIQLRQDDVGKTMYNIVGFQTHLTWPAQKKLIQMIPGLEHASIIRYGVMHKNHYIHSTEVLNGGYQVKNQPNLFIAGQLSGVEGYVESAASGLNAAIQLDQYLQTGHVLPFPKDTMIGAMARYVSTSNRSFVPMNANFGLMDAIKTKMKKIDRKSFYVNRAKEAMSSYMKEAMTIA